MDIHVVLNDLGVDVIKSYLLNSNLLYYKIFGLPFNFHLDNEYSSVFRNKMENYAFMAEMKLIMMPIPFEYFTPEDRFDLFITNYKLKVDRGVTTPPETLAEAISRFFYIAKSSYAYGAGHGNRMLSLVKQWDACEIDFRDKWIRYPGHQSRGNVILYKKENFTDPLYGPVIELDPYLKIDLTKADNYLLFIFRENAADLILIYHAHDLPYEYIVFRMDLFMDDDVRTKTIETYAMSDSFDDIAAYLNLYNKQMVNGEFVYSMNLDDTPIVLVTAHKHGSIKPPYSIYTYDLCKHAKILLQKNYRQM